MGHNNKNELNHKIRTKTLKHTPLKLLKDSIQRKHVIKVFVNQLRNLFLKYDNTKDDKERVEMIGLIKNRNDKIRNKTFRRMRK